MIKNSWKDEKYTAVVTSLDDCAAMAFDPTHSNLSLAPWEQSPSQYLLAKIVLKMNGKEVLCPIPRAALRVSPALVRAGMMMYNL
ncbi:hypothetical protein STEG23_032098 [Scotinomys teguina]